MESIKKLLAAFLVILASTGYVEAIIFTGPARRNAHRQEMEEAYEMGALEATRQNNKKDEDNNAINEADEVNDADDATVQVQSLGDGSLLGSLSDDEKSKIKQAVLKKLGKSEDSSDTTVIQSLLPSPSSYEGTVIQSLPEELDNESQEAANTMPEEQDQVLTAMDEHAASALAEIDQDIATSEQSAKQEDTTQEPAVIEPQEQVAQKNEEDVTEHQENFITKSIDDAQDQDQQIEDKIAIEIPTKSEQDQDQANVHFEQALQVASTFEHATQPAPVHEEPAVHNPAVLEPAVITQPAPVHAEPALYHQAIPVQEKINNGPVNVIQNAPQETVRIIKVYPVYEAIQSGLKHIKIAAQDMFNYVSDYFKNRKNQRQNPKDVSVQVFYDDK